MRWAEFVGPSYESRAAAIDAQRAINLYPERAEANSKSPVAYYRTPCLRQFSERIAAGAVFGFIEINGRVFIASTNRFYEILSDGTVVERGIIVGCHTKMVSNGLEVSFASLVAGASVLYLYTLATDVLTTPTAPCAGIEDMAYLDGYFVILEYNSQKIYISGLYDGSVYDAADVSSAESMPDNLSMILGDHKELWMFGTKGTQVFANTGNADFPLEAIPGAQIETGICGKSAAKCDNTLFWVGSDDRGDGVVWRANGYQPMRVSTHAIENTLRSWDLSSADAWSYYENGHTFYCLYVPGTDRMFCYDVATGLWHERCWWTGGAAWTIWPAQYHVYAFGKHLVADQIDNIILWQDLSNAPDLTYPMSSNSSYWARRAPYLSSEGKRVFFHSAEFDMRVGLGGIVGLASSQKVTLKWSDDKGVTWSTGLTVDLGAAGEVNTRVRFERLGSSRARIYELSGYYMDVAIMDAFLEVTGGNH